MSIERFAEWYPRYRQFISEPVYQELYNFLSSPHKIWAMAQSSEAGKPALTAVVKDLENEFKDRFDFDNPMNRRMIGSMIKEIIYDFGFRRKGQRLVSNSKYFSTASFYQMEKEKASKTVSGLFEVQSNERSIENYSEQLGESTGEEKIITTEQENRSNTKYLEEERHVEEELDHLIDVIKDDKSSEYKKSRAIEKLSSIGSVALDSIPTMLDILNDHKLTKSTVESLTKIAKSVYDRGGAAYIVCDLIRILRSNDKENKLLAIKALGDIGAPGATEAAPALAEALQDEYKEVKEEAAWALYEIGHSAFREVAPALIDAMEDDDVEVKIAVARAIGVCVPISIDALLDLLEHKNPVAQRLAAYELGRAGEYARLDAAQGLIKALTSEDLALKTTAAWALGSIRETKEEAIDALITNLNHQSDSVRETAIWALGHIGAEVKNFNREVFYEVLEDENSNIRKTAIWAIGNIQIKGDYRPLSLIMDKLNDEDDKVREKAAWAIGKLGANLSNAKPAVPLLVKALADESWVVRKAVTQALGRIGYFAIEALPSLTRVKEDLENEREIVRNMAAWAIQEISKYVDKENS